MALQPYDGEISPLDDGVDALKPYDGDLKPMDYEPPAKPEGKGITGHARDLGLSALKSAIAVPEAVVGLADIPTGGAVGKFLENKDGAIGFRPKEARDILSDLHTDQYKAQQREFQDADGVMDKTTVALKNPSLIANTVVESAAPMLAGGVAARGVMAATTLGQMGAKGAAAAGAIGEGATMAGAQAEAIRQETDDGLLTPQQAGAAVATGALGTLFGFAGGRLAQRLGIGDVDTMLARGAATSDDVAAELARTPAKSIPRQVVEGAISEGFLEELPQSISEQIIQNLALNKPWSDGVADAAVMGTLAGMAMGGGAALARGLTAPPRPDEQGGSQPQADQQAAPPPAESIFSTGDAPVLDDRALERAGVTPPPPAPVLDEDRIAQALGDAPQQPVALLPAPVFEAGADGTVRTTADINAGIQADRQALADRMRRLQTGDVLDVTPIPTAPELPSQQMGLDPSAGPMSAAAALAVDSGASPTLQAPAQANTTVTPSATTATPEALQPTWPDPVAETFRTQSPVPLENAQRLARMLNEMTGNEHVVIPSPDGRGFGVRTSDGLTAEQHAAVARFQTQAGGQRSARGQRTPTVRPQLGEQWDTMPADERAAVLAQKGGWSAKSGFLNVIGKRLMAQPWKDVPDSAKARIERLVAERETVGQAEGVATAGAATATEAERRLDHGELNIPGRTQGIDAALDRHKRELARAEKAQAKTDAQQRKEDKAEARRLLAEVGPAMQETLGPKVGDKALRDHLDQMVKWEARRFIALAHKFRAEQAAPALTVPSEAAKPTAEPAKPAARKPKSPSAPSEVRWLEMTLSEREAVALSIGQRGIFAQKTAEKRWDRLPEKVRESLAAKLGESEQAERAAATPAEQDEPDAPVAESDAVAEAARQAAPERPAESKMPATDAHDALMKAVMEGKATPEQFKASFESVVANDEAIKAELSTKTKAELLRIGGAYIQMRYANEKKAGVVDAVYRDMIGDYALGETVTYGIARDSYQNAVRRLVEATDADKLAKYAEDRKAAIEEAAVQRMARAEALENPKTLNDFRSLMNARIREGKTRSEAFLMLTPEQRIQYDTLEAESSREAREARKRAAKTEVRVAGQTTGGQIIATRHTRDGYDLFVVQLADRLGAEDYRTVLASAKKLGGWYSSFRGNGAVPGFQFKERENADAFLALAGGDTDVARAQVEQRRNAFEDDRSQSAAQRLTEMADRLEDAANEELGRDRKTNTARRARFASAAMNAAEAQKAMAKTMRNIAAAIEAGKATFLDAVRTKSQVEMLTGIVRTAKDNELRAKHASYAEQEKRKGERPSAETADFAEFPNYTAFRSDLASLARQLLEIDGTKKLGQKLMSVADDVTDAYLEFAKSNLLRVSQFGRGDSLADFSSKADAEKAIRRSNLAGKAIVLQVKRGQNRVILSPSEAMNRGVWTGDGDKRITLTGEFGAELVEAIGRRGSRQNQLSVPWQFQSAYDRRKALARIGIETPSEFRSALREFIALQETAIANKVRQMELAMVGRRPDGLDFFPTPAEIADQMVEAADIQPDMAVLEPSAGMGHIADRIRAAGAEPDVVEISADRRELLEEKGYHIAEVNDFLNMEPRRFFTYGDIFRAPDGRQGILRGLGGMGSQRVRLEDEQGNRLGLYNRDEVVGVSHRGSWSGYDRIIMNPPFSDRRDAEHVRHAYTLLRPGGRIVAIMGEGVFFGQDKRAQDFRDWLESVGGTSEKLPEGSFMDPSLPVQTGVNARMVVIDRPAGDQAATSTESDDARSAAVQFSFAGRSASGADLHALGTAQRRIAAGEDEEAVRQDTGWHRGADGKWRFEISDDQAQIAVGGDTAAEVLEAAALDGGTVRVADVLDHPQLFSAYPHIADIRVELVPAGERAAGRMVRRGDDARLQIRSDVKRGAMTSVMLHELQHAIQHAEGFARGGSAKALASDLDRTGAETYLRLAGEVEARNTQHRQRMTAEQRRLIAPEDTADVSASDVIVTFNGKPETTAPRNAGSRVPVTERGLLRALHYQFRGLEGPVEAMLAKGRRGEKGGLVVVDSADPLRLASVFSSKTGRPLDSSINLFSEGGQTQGLYDPKSGLTFLVGPNLDPVTAPAVLLHEMVHGQQRAKIDARAMGMLMSRGQVKDADLRAFLDRVAQRMVEADAASNPKEAAAYIVELAVMEGRSQGYTLADNRFFAWADATFGKGLGDFLRSVAAMVRTWMIRHGGIKALTVDDLVGYAMAGVRRAARGEVGGKTGRSVGPISDDVVAGIEELHRVLTGEPVATLRTSEAPHQGKAKLREWAVGIFRDYGFYANNPKLGRVLMDERSVRDSLGHSLNPFKAVAFKAVPDVIEKGVIAHVERKGKIDSIYISAPVVINGADDIVTVLVHRDLNAQRMYLHSVTTKESLLRSSQSSAGAEAPGRSGTVISGGISTILRDALNFKDIQFSRAGTRSPQQVAKHIGDGLKSITVQDVKRAGRHKLTDWLKLGLQFLGRRQLVDIYGDVLPLAEYDRLAAQMEADKNDVGAAADDLARRWGKLPDEGRLADLMHDATLAQIDADSAVAYAEGDDRMKSRMLKAQFNALTPEAQKVYREARDHYKNHHAAVRQAIIDRIERSELRSARRAELMKRMDDDFFQAIKGVYFPLARFGQYVVVAKDGAGKVASVSRAETMAEAEALRREMVRAFPAADGYQVGRVTLSKEFVASRDMVGRGFMTELYGALDEQNLPPEQLAELEDTLGQLYLSSLPDLSWAKHGIHRKGTPGFSQDARRAFAQNTFHGARYLAKLKYGDRMQTQLDGMQKHVDQMSAIEDFDQPAAQRVVDEMAKRHDAMVNPKSNPLSTALTSIGFIYYLGLSPAAAVVNLSQTPLVAYPVLGAKWGFKKAGAALMRASRESVQGKNDMRGQLKDADELRAYDEAVRSGVIDVTMAHDLAGIAQGEDAKVMWKIRPVMRLASYLFHHAERFNRQATFLAAYRLAREAGAGHDAAYSQAVKATYDGHFDYSAGNRPRVMQGNVARVVLLFKQYAQNMIFTIARNAYQSVAGESPEVRREARKVFAALMTMHAAAAGVLGLPLVGTLLTVASAMGGSDDEPWDAEVALRNMLADAFGPTVSEVIARGFSRLTPWDISGRVGLDKLLLPDVQEGLEGQRWAESVATAMLGPVIGMGVNAARGAQKMADGDYLRGIEDMLPVATRNPIKAYRYWDEGAQDRTGVEIKSDVGLAGVLGQAAGFSPSEVRLAFEGRSAVMDQDRRLAERRSELMGSFARAAMDQDQEEMDEARAAIAEFNQKNPGRRITAPQMWQSVRARQRRIDRAEDGVYLPRTRRDALEAGRFAEG